MCVCVVCMACAVSVHFVVGLCWNFRVKKLCLMLHDFRMVLHWLANVFHANLLGVSTQSMLVRAGLTWSSQPDDGVASSVGV